MNIENKLLDNIFLAKQIKQPWETLKEIKEETRYYNGLSLFRHLVSNREQHYLCYWRDTRPNIEIWDI